MIQGRRQKHDGETIRAPIWNAKPNGHTNFMIGSKVAQCNKRHARSVLTAWRLRNNTHTVKHNGHTTFRIVNRLCAIVRAPFLVRWTQSGRPRLVSISKVFHNAPHQSIRLCRPLTFRIPRWLADYIPWSLQCLKGCASSPGTETNRAVRVPNIMIPAGQNAIFASYFQERQANTPEARICKRDIQVVAPNPIGKYYRWNGSTRVVFNLATYKILREYSLAKPDPKNPVGTQQNKHQLTISSLTLRITALLELPLGPRNHETWRFYPSQYGWHRP